MENEPPPLIAAPTSPTDVLPELHRLILRISPLCLNLPMGKLKPSEGGCGVMETRQCLHQTMMEMGTEVRVLIPAPKVPEEPGRCGAEGIQHIVAFILQRGVNTRSRFHYPRRFAGRVGAQKKLNFLTLSPRRSFVI